MKENLIRAFDYNRLQDLFIRQKPVELGLGMKCIGRQQMIFKRKAQKKTYDKENCSPVLRCSICTGERVAGFKNLRTGKFEEITLIRNDRELKEFMELYGIDTITKEY